MKVFPENKHKVMNTSRHAFYVNALCCLNLHRLTLYSAVTLFQGKPHRTNRSVDHFPIKNDVLFTPTPHNLHPRFIFLFHCGKNAVEHLYFYQQTDIL